MYHWYDLTWKKPHGESRVQTEVYPRRRNATTSMVGLKNGHIRKNLTKNGEPQRSSWGTQKKMKKPQVCHSPDALPPTEVIIDEETPGLPLSRQTPYHQPTEVIIDEETPGLPLSRQTPYHQPTEVIIASAKSGNPPKGRAIR